MDAFYIHGPFAKAKRTILSAVARNNNCKTVGSAKLTKLPDDAGAFYVHLFGFESDVRATKAMFASLLVFASAEVLRAHRRNMHVHGKAFSQSFYISFGDRIGERLEEMNKKIMDETPSSTALVFVGRDIAVQNKVESTFSNLRNTRLNHTSVDGAAAGVRAANSARLNKEMGGSRGAIGR
jgi:hypothetical protein